MTKKLVVLFSFVFFINCFSVIAQEQDDLDPEMWYEFDLSILSRDCHVYAFKNDAQLDNRGPSLMRVAGWGLRPDQNFRSHCFPVRHFEKTKIYDQLKKVMEKEGYQYAFFVEKKFNDDMNTIYLYTFMLMGDDLYYQSHTK